MRPVVFARRGALSNWPVACTSALLALAPLFLVTGCHGRSAADAAAEAPPSNPTVIATGGSGLVHIDRPAEFPLVQATTRTTYSTLDATGSVQPDPSRELPVLSIANGRVTALHVGLGDYVHKGQLVMEVQSPDVTTAFDTYLKAVADEHLNAVTLTRDELLFSKGAISEAQLQIAQDGEADARADLRAAEQQLRLLGVDKSHPGDTVKVYAPATGVIIAQNTAAAGAAGISYAGNMGSFTIADLSHVWVVCDVFENDLSNVHLGEQAVIHLNAFPDKPRTGTISDIGAVLDPTIRTAKVRIAVPNPDKLLRIGMFATATFRGTVPFTVPVVPADSVLRLHDTTYAFEPAGAPGNYRRVQVRLGRTLEGNVVEILGGLNAGQQVVANALELQNTADQ